MKWLFLYVLFDISSGSLVPKLKVTSVWATAAECRAMGTEMQNRAAYNQPGFKSFSTCIPSDAYDAPIGKIETQTF